MKLREITAGKVARKRVDQSEIAFNNIHDIN